MKTTVQVSLNGIAFNLDENAYRQLKSYIDELQLHFANNTEIIDDIEARIADLLSLRIKSAEQAVSINDINEIVETIGKPEDFDEEANTENFRKHFENTNNSAKKRLYRDTDNKIIAGVCSGIGHYLNINVAWIRVIFIVFAVTSIKLSGLHFWFSNHFIFGIPFMLFVYIVLWIVVPRTKTPRQNLEMHGYTSAQHSADIDSSDRRNDFGSFIINVFRLFIQICAGISLSIIGIVCISLLFAGIACFFGGSLFGGKNLVSLLDYVYIGEINVLFVKSLIAALIFIPVGVLAYVLLKILMRLKVKDKPVMIFLFAVWFIAAMLAFGCAVTVFENYRYKSRVHTSETFTEINLAKTKTLNVKIPDEFTPLKLAFVNLDCSRLYATPTSNSLFICPSVHIIRVDSIQDNYIKVVKSARASTTHAAKQKAQAIPNGYTVSDSATIMLQPMEFDKTRKWESELIDIYVYLPEYVQVKFEN
jgi:phage shock protein PspC (stress-responsive transcriptional regulator)